MKIALTPLDGRYFEKISELTKYLSEDALNHYRANVEILWLRKFCEVVGIECEFKEFEIDIEAIKQIENELHHDVKAVETWIARELKSQSQTNLISYVHFGRTSEDINSVAYALMLRDALKSVIEPNLSSIHASLVDMAMKYKSIPMLARTHGQPASPTTVGKEFMVFSSRLSRQLERLKSTPIQAKFSGATGTYAADIIAYPEIDWPTVMKDFITGLGLEYSDITTQIEPHDWIVDISNTLSHINSILIDCSRDIWEYISLGYLKLKIVDKEVGSSTMPHKVNPIDFENAEANLGLANALFNHYAYKLPISRLQRDLSDSSVMRTFSESFGHMTVALKSLQYGLNKIVPDKIRIADDLDDHWELLTEAVQTVMRKNGIDNAYEQMKDFSRGKEITKENLQEFINNLDIDDDDKQRLLELTPASYIGFSDSIG
ncbi:adenylosuccinate lyase [Candidatus Saccharibacteria bacterium]|nr:adenylosuccinate lyase [Candidatus Saccharibacteria bacterium]